MVRLQEYKNQASNAESGIVAYLIKSPEQAVNCSIYTLAQRTFSSSATIVRFCRKLGFDGYKDLQKSLLYEMALRQDSVLQLKKDIHPQDTLEEIAGKVTLKNMITLEDTCKLLDMEVLKSTVDLLVESKSVGLFGIGSSLLVAKDMHLKLMRVGKSCQLCDDWHAQLLQAKNMGKEDLGIIFSYSGLTDEMLVCAKELKDNGAPIIAITRFEESPLAAIADHCLSVASTEMVFRSSAMASRIAQLNLVDILYAAFINRDYDNNMLQFNRTHMKKG